MAPKWRLLNTVSKQNVVKKMSKIFFNSNMLILLTLSAPLKLNCVHPQYFLKLVAYILAH